VTLSLRRNKRRRIPCIVDAGGYASAVRKSFDFQSRKFNTEDAVKMRQWTFVGVALLAGGMLAGGCGEIITYSYKSRAQGVALYEEQRYDDAAGAFRNATQQNPRDYISFYYLGKSYEASGRQQQALQSYRTSVEVMPVTFEGKQDKEFRLTVIEALANCIANAPGREQEIAVVAETASRTQKGNDFFVLARTYVASGDADAAIDAYSRATLAAPNDVQITRSAALYLERIGQTAAAEPVLRRAYQQNPLDVDVAEALRRIGVVPGPSLLEERKLVSPIIPKGPIPEMELRVKDNRAVTAGQTP
jgi:tetratricopeptide (TPR) repeat protein